ncbi:MAG: hypothetical protein QOH61_609 [Chloroflexota bacterium]|jgi:hypothetical protein|nr:hypothetical protein [Chloroflexota bacterium]
MKSRPTSALLLAGLALVTGILSFIGGWWLLLGGTVGTTFGAPTGTAVIVLGALMFATGLASLAVGYGLWAIRHWAWSGAFVIFGVSIAIDAVSVFLTSVSPLDVAVTVGVAVAAMWYLLQPKQRALYGHERAVRNTATPTA